MSPRERPADRAARQLRALMDRHGVKDAAKFQRMMEDSHFEPLISQVTIRRILNAEARSRPETTTLQRLAEFLGESLVRAFPEPEDETAITVDVAGRKIAFRAEDGRPITPADADRIRKALEALTTDRAQEIHDAKKQLRKR